MGWCLRRPSKSRSRTPIEKARFCSSQLPSRSQVWQSMGWLSTSSSTMSRRAWRISGELVWTSIPSQTATLHEAMK